MSKRLVLIPVLAILLGGLVAALDVSVLDPNDGETYTNEYISLSFLVDEASDLSYSVNDDNATLVCSNCTSYEEVLQLVDGNYSLVVFATLGNVTVDDSVVFFVDTVVPEENETETEALELTVSSPVNGTTYDDDVSLDFSTNLAATISYALDGDNLSVACENCTAFSTDLELGEGTYDLVVQAVLGNETVEETLEFVVDFNETEELELTVSSPVEGTTYNDDVSFSFETNYLATIEYAVNNDNLSVACTNCTEFDSDFELTEGNYELLVQATRGNETVEETIEFIVDFNTTDDTNDDEDNETDGEPRFSTGFQKLPKEVATGLYTDEELADIIRNNDLNPGVINRLVKTGMLGEKSIDAIIETQWTPPGIFRKVMGWFGFHIPTPKEALVEEYDLSEEQQAAILASPDTSTQGANKIRNNLEKKVPPGQAKKIQVRNTNRNVNVENEDNEPEEEQEQQGTSGSIAPGQAKKSSGTAGKSGKIPPGQAKKSFNAGGQRR